MVHVGDYKMCFATVEVFVNKRTRWKKWTTGKKIFRKKIQCGLQHNMGYNYSFFVTCLTDVFSLVELLLIQLGKARLAPKCPTTVQSEGRGTFHPPSLPSPPPPLLSLQGYRVAKSCWGWCEPSMAWWIFPWDSE